MPADLVNLYVQMFLFLKQVTSDKYLSHLRTWPFFSSEGHTCVLALAKRTTRMMVGELEH